MVKSADLDKERKMDLSHTPENPTITMIIVGLGLVGGALKSESSELGINIVQAYKGRQECDITDQELVNRLIGESGADVVFNGVAAGTVDNIQKEFKGNLRDMPSYGVMVEGTRNLVNACQRAGSFLVQPSTGFVNIGEEGSPPLKPVPIESPFDPTKQSAYAGLAIDREREVLEGGGGLVRFNFPTSPTDGWMWTFIKTIELGYGVFDDQITNFVSTRQLARVLSVVARSRNSGIYHAGSSTELNDFETARRMAKNITLRDKEGKLLEVKTGKMRTWMEQKAKQYAEKGEFFPWRPYNCVLDTTDMERILGMTFPTMEEEIDYLCARRLALTN